VFAAHVSRDNGGAGIPATYQRRSLRQIPVSPKANGLIQILAFPELLVKGPDPGLPLELLLNAGDVSLIQERMPGMASENVQVIERLLVLSDIP
jgi:hypothetical protein